MTQIKYYPMVLRNGSPKCGRWDYSQCMAPAIER